MVKVSAKVRTLPALTIWTAPGSVSFAVLATEFKLVKAGVAPAALTVTALFTVALTHVFCKVIFERLGAHHAKFAMPTNC